MPHVVVGHYDFELVCGPIGWKIAPPIPPNPMGHGLHTYGGGPFCSFRIHSNYTCPGMYILTSDRKYPVCPKNYVNPLVVKSRVVPRQVFGMYIGVCTNLSDRFNAGFGCISPSDVLAVGGRQTMCRINNLIHDEVGGGNAVELWFYPWVSAESEGEEFLEKQKEPLRRGFLWPWNK